MNNKMEQVINSTKLNQLLNKPTKTTSPSATLQDLIVTNNPPKCWIMMLLFIPLLTMT